jgi:uncharacterized protein YciI
LPQERFMNFTRFVIVLDKVPGKEAKRETISQHVEHLRTLDAQGKLILCGPFTDFPSGMVIVSAKDKTEAIAIANSDPFVIEGVRNYRDDG